MNRSFFFIILIFAAFAKAEDLPASDKIVIGQSVELSGQATGKENMQGALAYFGWLNAQGGVHGRQVELKSYDDKRDPVKTRQNTEKLLREDKVLALFGYRSTPTVEAALPLLQEAKVALVAPFSGAQSLIIHLIPTCSTSAPATRTRRHAWSSRSRPCKSKRWLSCIRTIPSARMAWPVSSIACWRAN